MWGAGNHKLVTPRLYAIDVTITVFCPNMQILGKGHTSVDSPFFHLEDEIAGIGNKPDKQALTEGRGNP